MDGLERPVLTCIIDISQARHPRGDPAFEHGDFLWTQLPGLDRHSNRVIGRTDSLHQQTLGGLAGNHDRSILAAGQCRLAAIQPESGFLFLTAMATKAVGPKQRQYLQLEIDLVDCGCQRGSREQDQQGKWQVSEAGAHGVPTEARERDDYIVVREVTTRQVSWRFWGGTCGPGQIAPPLP